ncbi:glutamyl-tRNA reductase [Candidatus Magnetoovum chiemensis]|nr:glutamyl-tRNA reductase [Candidatus Magnetoovum chiemensis]
MSIITVGLNHKTADIDVREKIAFNGVKYVKGLRALHSMDEVEEIIILSTCNRVEIYLKLANYKDAVGKVKEFLCQFHGVEAQKIDNALYVYKDLEAVRHVFRVASSLDSMVVGEPQILGQLKDAFDEALHQHTSGIILNKLMKKAISVAKRVRTETKIAENAVSISYAAVELAKKIFTQLNEKVCMLLGAGEMAELAAKHLTSAGIKEVIVSNRTFERGCAIAKEFKGRAVEFSDFKNEIVNVDILICSTGAPNYVLLKDEMEKIMKKRKHKPVFIIDISVPRNIAPEINNIGNVYLYDVDDLQTVVDANMNERHAEALKAENIVSQEIEVFSNWLNSLNAVPTILALRKMAEDIKNTECSKTLKKLPQLSQDDVKAIEYMATAIVNKLIHPPTVALKDETEDKDVLIAAINRIYGLNGKVNNK